MSFVQKTARVAGLLYLVVVVSGFFHLLYVPSRLLVPGDAAATVSHLVAGEGLFRLGILGGFVCYTAFLVLPVALYRLFAPAHPTGALLLLVLAAASVPFSFANMLNKLAILPLLPQVATSSAAEAGMLREHIMQYLQHYQEGNGVAQIFWGLWLLPFGYVVLKSGVLPQALGVLLLAGGVGYLLDFSADLLWPAYPTLGLGRFLTLPAGLAEVGTCLWLLLRGVRTAWRVPAGPARPGGGDRPPAASH